MTLTTLKGARLAGEGRVLEITIREGVITSEDVARSAAAGYEEVDATGLTLAPGLIDLQVNGAYGADFTSDPGSIWQVGARLPEQGVTAFLPTIVTSNDSNVRAAREALDKRPPDYGGAEPLGLHLEGPMLSPRRPGVHDLSLLRSPSTSLVRGWTPTERVSMVTMAPELPGSEAVIETLVEAGVIVSAGHSAATLEEAAAAFAWGVTAVTHLFNAMEPFDHRAPGLVGAVVRDARAIAGIIADGLHLDPVTVFAAWKWLGPARLALVTDAMAAAGLGDGDYDLGPAVVKVRNGRATDANGRLAGSTLTLDQAVRNLIRFAACSAGEALAAASSVPAALLGLTNRGHLRAGARADLVLFDDSMEVVATMVAGQFAFARAGWNR